MPATPLPPIPPTRRMPSWRIALLLVGVTVAVFGRTLWNGFLDWDDNDFIVNSPLLTADSGWAFMNLWRGAYLGLYWPLTYMTYAAIAAFTRAIGSPMAPAYFHGVQLGVHIVGGLALWRWLTRLCGDERAAAVGALCWLVHPMQVEAVAWAASLNTALGGTLGLIGLWAASVGATSVGRKRWAWLSLGVLAATLALTAKSLGAMLPAMLLVAHRFVLRRPWKETLVLAGVWAAALSPFVLMGGSAQSNDGLFETAPPLLMRVPVAMHAFGFYLWHLLWPAGYGVDYGLSPAAVLRDRRWTGPAMLAVAAAVVAVVTFRRRPWIAAGLGIFLVAVAPVLGFLPFYFQGYSTVADRYAYIAGSGAALVVAFAWRQLIAVLTSRRSMAVAWVGASAMVLILATQSVRQVGVWHDDASLMTHAMAVNPDSLAAIFELATLADRAGRLDEAAAGYGRLLARRPYNAVARGQFGDLLLRTGRFAEAAEQLDWYVRLRPAAPIGALYLGRARLALGQDNAALPEFTRAVALDPTVAEAWAGLGAIHARRGDAAAARAAYDKALALDPAEPTAVAGRAALAAPASGPLQGKSPPATLPGSDSQQRMP